MGSQELFLHKGLSYRWIRKLKLIKNNKEESQYFYILGINTILPLLKTYPFSWQRNPKSSLIWFIRCWYFYLILITNPPSVKIFIQLILSKTLRIVDKNGEWGANSLNLNRTQLLTHKHSYSKFSEYPSIII